MRNKIFIETLADERAGQIIATIKRFFAGLFILSFVALLVILLMEIKREFSIDLIQGVNFKADDWYFENTGR